MTIYKNAKGFTLIETIAVLIVLGILSAVVISRVTSTAEVNLKAQTEVLKSHIRYAQFRAMNMKSNDPAATGCNASFGIGISGNTYFMFRDCDTGNKVILPGASGDTITLPSVTLNPSSAFMTFDDWGRPCSDLLGTTQAAGSITLSSAGVSDETITITNNTGFVP